MGFRTDFMLSVRLNDDTGCMQPEPNGWEVTSNINRYLSKTKHNRKRMWLEKVVIFRKSAEVARYWLFLATCKK